VRLIARGVTLEYGWPTWVREAAPRLVLTEIDAYLPTDQAPHTLPLVAPVEAWLRQLFDGIWTEPSAPAEKAFWGAAQTRVLRDLFFSWPLVVGLAHRHGADVIQVTGGSWVGLPGLRALVTATGGRVVGAKSRPRGLYGARLIGWVAATAAGAVGWRLYEYWRERTSRARLRELRRKHRGQPQIWVGLLGDWPRSCRHVIETMGPLAQRTGTPFGVLLQNSLQPGRRKDDDTHGHDGREPFPTLEHLRLAGTVAAVEQCCAAEAFGELTANFVRSLWATMRLCARLTRQGPVVRFGAAPLDLEPRLGDLARLITLDVMRARESALATHAAMRRHRLAGSAIVWPHASLANVAVPDLILQAGGATTYDFVHGGLNESLAMLADARTHSTIKVLWTEAEAKYMTPYAGHQQRRGGFLPRLLPPLETRRAKRRGPLRLLVVTNYLCHQPGGHRGLGLESYQTALFDALTAALRALPTPPEVRWRPHPADWRDRVHAVAKERRRELPMSLSLEPGGLHDDLRAADIVIAAVSSSIVEALWFPVPILVHAIPIHEELGVLSFFADERKFRDATELTDRLARCIAALADDTIAAIRPEREVRARFFGPSGVQHDFADLFGPTAITAPTTLRAVTDDR
jgi:hypothetical protein